MKHERLILCGGASAPRGVRAEPLKLDLWGGHPNVFLKIHNITDAVMKNPPAVLLDLLDMATYLYAGDQSVPRGGTRSFDYGDSWSRRLRYVIPLRKFKVWNRPAVKEALAELLAWMTDDEFEFSFPKYEKAPKLPSYLEFDKDTPNPTRIEEVCLFSGGLDSLAGAVKEAVVDGRKVALVAHSPAAILHHRQGQLVQALTTKCKPDRQPFFMHVWANKSSGLTKDTSQRIRSFLYASLGAVIAGLLKLNRTRFYENGPISLNLPICEQLVGAQGTRVTHPRTLAGMSKLFSLLLDREFAVENPFLWKTRTDIVLDLKTAGAADLIRYTVSCSHTRRRTKGYPHCGCCSQCIDRRFAVLAAGCEEYDPADSYELDVLTDAREKTEDRTMLERYLGFAAKAEEIEDENAFFTEFPEAYATVNAIDGDRQESAKQVAALCKRHGKQVNAVIDGALAEHVQSGAFRRGELPDTCALMLVAKEHLADGDMTKPDAQGTSEHREHFRATIEDMTVGILAGAKATQGKTAVAGKPPRSPGRKRLSAKEEQRRVGILDRWERASGQCSRKQFCDDEGITIKQLENCQRWKQQRENRGG